MCEFISKKEIVSSNASTYSGNEMLQSAGMIIVDIIKQGKRININACLEIVIPGLKVDGMQPYFTNYARNVDPRNWRRRKGKIRYDDYHESYILDICGAFGGSFGINCDKRVPSRGTENGGTILVKVKKL